jgi:hypothetical protein
LVTDDKAGGLFLGGPPERCGLEMVVCSGTGTNAGTASFNLEHGGKRWVSRADHYQKLAAECLLLAKTANNQTNRATLLQMAATWLKLAEREQIENTVPSGLSD